MMQVTTSLLFVAAAIASLAAILAMLKNNQSAIFSALAGRGAFPMATTPEKGPAAQIIYVARPARRTAQRGKALTAAAPWSHAA